MERIWLFRISAGAHCKKEELVEKTSASMSRPDQLLWLRGNQYCQRRDSKLCHSSFATTVKLNFVDQRLSGCCSNASGNPAHYFGCRVRATPDRRHR